MSGWGGKREEAGRPLLAGEARKMRCLRATDKEWAQILQFARIIKYGDKEAAEKFLAANKV